MNEAQSPTEINYKAVLSNDVNEGKIFQLQQRVWQLEEQLSLALRTRDYAIARASDLNGVYRLSEDEKKELSEKLQSLHEKLTTQIELNKKEKLQVYRVTWEGREELLPTYCVAFHVGEARSKIHALTPDQKFHCEFHADACPITVSEAANWVF